MIIYAITNRVNGKRYIGMTEMTLARRWWQHQKATASGSRTILHCAIRKYGPDAFDVRIVAEAVLGANRDDLAALESLLIEQEKVLTPFGYNMTAGGDGIPRGHRHANEYATKGKPWSEARRLAHEHPELATAKITAPVRTAKPRKRPLTPEQLSALHSATLKRLWAEKRDVMSAGAGKFSDETRERIRAALRKKNASPEHREKLRASWAANPERRAAAAQRMALANKQGTYRHGN